VLSVHLDELVNGHLSIVARVQIIVFFCFPILRWLSMELVHDIFIFGFFDV